MPHKHVTRILTHVPGGAITTAGAFTTMLGWADGGPAFPLGLTLLIIGVLMCAGVEGVHALRRPSRQMDVAFEEGLQLGEIRGFREGRKVAPLRLVRDGHCAHCGQELKQTA